jgi:shikimate dehydrogenase
VAHSASPRLFAALARRVGLSFHYGAERVVPAELASFLGRVRGGAYQGLSVTLPHKVEALRLSDTASESARAIGAANTLRVQDGHLQAHNTDGVGLVLALGSHGVTLSGARVLLLGAGGAARAAAHAARAAGAQRLWVANRTAAHAEALAAKFAGQAVPLSAAALAPLLGEVDVLIQASAAGLGRPEETALPTGCVLHPGMTVLDMVYQPLQTQLLRTARAAGARGVDGLWMLVHQAVEQLRLWTGVEVGQQVASALHAQLEGGPL